MTLYRPSNGTEGECFISQGCSRCERERAYREGGYDDPDLACDIQTWTMALGIDDPKYPREWQYGDDGRPRCTAFRLATTAALSPEDERNQFGLFA
jgi:hypothetical protein